MRRFSLFLAGWFLITSVACSTDPDAGTSSSEESSDQESGSDAGSDSAQTASCDSSAVTSYTYLMAFHACAADCSDPSNHDVYLAGSNDGASWALIEEFESFAGSVPELVYTDGKLFLHTPNEVRAYNACFQELGSEEVSLVSDEDSGGYVDPSLIAADGEVHMFYLPGIVGQDPAGCSSYPCTKEIHSAIASDTAQTEFSQTSGARAEIELSFGTASDPEIISAGGVYLLYVSSGQSVLVFTGPSLTGSFVSPDGDVTRAISNGSGGVPSAFAAANGEVWLYVTKNDGDTEVIRRAVSSDGVTALADSAFSTAVDASINPALCLPI